MNIIIKFLKIFLVFIFLFLILDISFFYYIVIQEQQVFLSQQKYLNEKSRIFLPKYFIRLMKFNDDYKGIIENHLRPIQNPESKEQPILIFGCSYAYGYVFDNEETISYIMSKYSNRPIINRAISCWGIQHMLYQLKEDKTFFSSIKPPKYIFYILMDHGSHFFRLFHTNFPNILNNEYYFTYKLKNNELVERKPFLNLYYGFAIPRHIYNKFVSIYVGKSLRYNNPKLYDFIILHFLKINEEISKLWKTNKIENLPSSQSSPKFIILTFEGNQEQLWKSQLEQQGIQVINIAELIGKEDLMNPKFGFFEPEVASHPNGKLWKEVVPKLKELYPDL